MSSEGLPLLETGESVLLLAMPVLLLLLSVLLVRLSEELYTDGVLIGLVSSCEAELPFIDNARVE